MVKCHGICRTAHSRLVNKSRLVHTSSQLPQSTIRLNNFPNQLLTLFIRNKMFFSLTLHTVHNRSSALHGFIQSQEVNCILDKAQNGKNTNDKIRKTEQQPQKQSPASNLASLTVDVLQKFWRDVQVQLCTINFTIATEPNGTDYCSHCAYCVSVVLLSK
ncbi:conserved hypothetical protein [Trichinella spiralis]|uniref:hypothetical protein n=1 Tax=Trichinella spiralis TaxID=6334 RepID=UPI0001EFE58D|nr:conserved hypothetical protein [Trichinella spiralis]